MGSRVGLGVGALVGLGVVGDGVGAGVGGLVGDGVGRRVGEGVGPLVGGRVGLRVGGLVGGRVGLRVGGGPRGGVGFGVLKPKSPVNEGGKFNPGGMVKGALPPPPPLGGRPLPAPHWQAEYNRDWMIPQM